MIVYCALALVAFWHDLPLDNAHILAESPPDTTAVGWFLGYVGFASSHGHNPLFTNWMDFPSGINLAANQSLMLLGIVLTPFTLLVGPFATLSFTMFAALVATAMAMYGVLRYFRCRPLAAFAGGLLFGFGPLQVAHSLVEPIFTFLPALPVIFLLAYRLTSEPERVVPRRDGVLLGVACAVQLYVSPEPLVDIFIVSVTAVVVVTAFRARHVTRAELAAAVTGLCWGAGPFIVLALPFLYYYLAGPQHVSGPELGLSQLAVFHTDLAGIIAPNKNMLLAPGVIAKRADLYAQGTLNESGAYLGIPLVLVVGVLAWRERRSRLVQFALVVFLTSLVLSLGPVLWVNNDDTGVPLPDRLLTHLPLVQSTEPALFFVGADLAVAVILAVGLSGLVRNRQRDAVRGPGAGLSPALAVAAVAAVALVPLTPNWPNRVVPVDVPSYFTTSEVDAIPPDATVLTYPVAGYGAVQPMQWQMAAHFRFKLVSGFGYVANNGGVPLGSPPMSPPELSEVERYAYGGVPGKPRLPLFTRSTFRDIRRVLARFRVDDFIALPVGHYRVVSRYVSAALGEPGHLKDGVLVWYGVHVAVQRSLRGRPQGGSKGGIIATYPPPSNAATKGDGKTSSDR
ncbi:MAG: hypothetical protein ACRDZX_09585 [Acidimicrobiales bacterium]